MFYLQQASQLNLLQTPTEPIELLDPLPEPNLPEGVSPSSVARIRMNEQADWTALLARDRLHSVYPLTRMQTPLISVAL